MSSYTTEPGVNNDEFVLTPAIIAQWKAEQPVRTIAWHAKIQNTSPAYKQIEAGWRAYKEQADDVKYVNMNLCTFHDLGTKRVLVLANKQRTMALVMFEGEAPTPTQIIAKPEPKILNALAARVRANKKES